MKVLIYTKSNLVNGNKLDNVLGVACIRAAFDHNTGKGLHEYRFKTRAQALKALENLDRKALKISRVEGIAKPKAKAPSDTLETPSDTLESESKTMQAPKPKTIIRKRKAPALSPEIMESIKNASARSVKDLMRNYKNNAQALAAIDSRIQVLQGKAV